MRGAIDLHDLRPLDPSARMPLHAQLAERLAAPIRGAQDQLAGRLLPSEATLGAHFGVSRPTVRQAMGRLASDGLVLRGRGRGTSVAPPHASRDLGSIAEFELLPPSGEITFRLLGRQRIAATPALRALFQLPAGEPLERLTRLRLIQGEIFAHEERFLPARIAARLTDQVLSEEAGLVFIRRFIAGRSGQVAFRFSAIPASAAQATLLGMRRGAPLLSSEHTYCGADAVPILHGTILFRGDRYDFGFRAPVHGSPDHADSQG